MRTYTVHEPPEAPAGRIERAERLVFVKDGFSWMAALFPPVWLIVHRLWWPLFGYLVLGAVLGGLGNLIAWLGWMSDPDASAWTGLAGMALNLLIGFEASVLRRWGLDRRRWRTVGSVSGRSAQECERRFFELWLPAQPSVVAAAGGGPLGSTVAGALPSGV
jgi:hypothetical protein